MWSPVFNYIFLDVDSFDEDDASSVSSGDISDTLDLVDTPDPESSEFSSQGTDHYLKSRLNNSLSTPYKQSNTGFNSGDNMRDRTSGKYYLLLLSDEHWGIVHLADNKVYDVSVQLPSSFDVDHHFRSHVESSALLGIYPFVLQHFLNIQSCG